MRKSICFLWQSTCKIVSEPRDAGQNIYLLTFERLCTIIEIQGFCAKPHFLPLRNGSSGAVFLYPRRYSRTISRSIRQHLPSLFALIFPLTSNCFAVLSVQFNTTHNCSRFKTSGTSFQFRYRIRVMLIPPFVVEF